MAALCYAALLALLSLTGLLLWAKLFSVLSRLRLLSRQRTTCPLPATASAVVAAFLPADSDAILTTAAAFLEVEYPGHLEVILAFASPQDGPHTEVEAGLAAIAGQMPERFQLFRLVGATDRGSCADAAQKLATGELVGIFQPGQVPARDCMQQAQQVARTLQLSAQETALAPPEEAAVELTDDGSLCSSGSGSAVDSVLEHLGAVFGCQTGEAKWSDFTALLSPALSWRQKATIGCSLTWTKVLPAALAQALPLLAFLCYYKDSRQGRLGLEQTFSMGPGLLVPSH